VRVSLASRDRAATIIVEDRGPGIPAEHQARIFERFERGASSSGTSGLGLGLFIVKEIVDAHRGSIAVDSRVGEGARFTVTLPLYEDGRGAGSHV
jgi:signal transduction histidine kinase